MKRALSIATVIALFQGCAAQPPHTFMLADFQRAAVLPYDSPPQVIYRIDDHRFVTLEKYRDCNHGITYYNDTKAGIREELGRAGIENFQGRLINADPTGRNIVIPSAGPPEIACSDRGCTTSLIYSTDGGRTFAGMSYMNSFHPFQDSKKYSVVVTKDGFYVAETIQDDAYVIGYLLKRSGSPDQPNSVRIERETFTASKRPHIMDGLHSPSGQERFTCDASIMPTNPDAPLTRN
jgi:hypothetical protein